MNLRQQAFRALKRAEAFFKIDMVYLARGGWWTSLHFAIGTAISLVTLIAFGNLVSKETYGTYNYLLSFAASLTFLTLSGMSTAVIRAVARGHENVTPYALRMQLKYNAVTVLAIGAAAAYYWAKGNSVFGVSLLVLAFALPVSSAYHLYESVFIGKKRFDLIALVASLSTLLTAGSTLITLFLTDSITALILVYAATSILPNVLAYFYASKNLEPSAPDENAIAEMRHTTFHLTGAGIIGTFVQYIDKIILFQVAGPASLAVYGFATAGPERLKGLIKNWAGVTLPRHSVKNLDDVISSFYGRITLLLGIGSLMAASYIIVVPFLFKLFLPKYLDSILYSQVYALSLIFIPIVLYIGNIFAGQNMLRATYLFSTGAHVMRITLFLVLGWKWQVWGLVAASLLSYFLNAVYGIIVLRIESKRLLPRT